MNHHPSDRSNPVLLIHGLDDTIRIFDRMAPFLQAHGRKVHAIGLTPSNGDVGLEHLAQQVADYVATSFAADQSLDLIGFSMGGIVSRYYLQRLGGLCRVQRFISLASPHHGTWTAYCRQNIGARQMRPNSPFLQDLNQDVQALAAISVTSIWTPMDLMIIPAHSSELPIGQNLQIPVAYHPWMVKDRSSLETVAQLLAQPVTSDRQPARIPLPQK